MTRVVFTRAALQLGFLLSICAAGVEAQDKEPPPQRPAFRSLRYDEDWSVLRDPRLRTDPWDRVKFIPLGEDDRYLSLGGESRLRYEGFHHNNFGVGPQDENGYLLQRYLVHSDLHITSHARVFAQLQSGIESGRNGGPRPTDEDVLDVHQAFVDLRGGSARRSLTLRAGRQEVEFGSGRLIAASEGLNVRRSFDAIRPIYRHGAWEMNGFIGRLVETERGAFDDGHVPGEAVWGIGGAGPHGWWSNGGLGVYLYRFRRDRAPFAFRTGRERRYTLGTRHFGRAGAVNYSADAIYQWGTFDEQRIRAWAIASELRVIRPSSRLQPAIRANAASGDSDPDDDTLETFNPMFPSTSYSGRAALLGPPNVIDVTASLRTQLHRAVALTTESSFIWRQGLRDTLFTVNIRPFPVLGRTFERFVAVQPSIQGEWFMDRHSTLQLVVTRFQRGAHLREVGALSVTYFGAFWIYRI